jgi:hypothetical protein
MNGCQACGSDRAPWHLLNIGHGFGDVRACINPKACRERAQAAGIWRTYNRTGSTR